LWGLASLVGATQTEFADQSQNEQYRVSATMNPGQMPHVDFQLNSMHELVKAHQEQLRVK
jgi:hypothetical protein